MTWTTDYERNVAKAMQLLAASDGDVSRASWAADQIGVILNQNHWYEAAKRLRRRNRQKDNRSKPND